MIFIIFCFLITVCGTSTSNRIAGGADTSIEEYPFVASLEFSDTGLGFWRQRCAGSLLTSVSVLTVAHCLYGHRPRNWRARVGSNNITSGGSIHRISSFRMHEEFSIASLENDVCIAKLRIPVVFSETIGRVSIPMPKYSLNDGDLVTVLGWGVTRGLTDRPEGLQSATLTVLNQQSCKNIFSANQPDVESPLQVSKGMLCTSAVDQGPCLYDNGGPLIHGSVVIGLVSWANACSLGDESIPSVFTDVAYHFDWILWNTLN